MKIEEAKKLREMSVEVENPDLGDFILDEENKQITLRNKPLEYVLACEPKAIKRLVDSYLNAIEALKWYASDEAMSCRIRKRYIDQPKCLEGDGDYFQDPSELPIVTDGGKRAREFLRSVEK